MSKFNIGDRVRRINCEHDTLKVGDEGVISGVSDNGNVMIMGGDPRYSHMEENLELVERLKSTPAPSIPSPIVTETVTRIEPGVYGRIEVMSGPVKGAENMVQVSMKMAGTNGHWSDASELRKSAATLTALADHLDNIENPTKENTNGR